MKRGIGKGVKKGTIRGPYKKPKFNENGDIIPKYKWKTQPKSKSYLDCPIDNCPHPIYRFGYCWKHQGQMTEKELLKVPEYYCELCNNKIEYNCKSQLKSICKHCFPMMGMKCKMCDKYTIDFESGYCVAHLPENRCSIKSCNNKSCHEDDNGDKYCTRHYPGKKCTHVIEKECGVKTGNTKHCKKHGGLPYASRRCRGVITTCQYKLEPYVCGKRIPFSKEKDMVRVLEPTKCIDHGGGVMCDFCGVKPACFDQNGMCEDHGGTRCDMCRGPMLKYSNKNICQKCRRKTDNAKRKNKNC